MTSAQFDIILRGGTEIDGTGGAGKTADLAISGDKIAAIGNLAGAQAAKVIQAQGKVVSPGFIDCHNHSDGWLLKYPNFESKTLQGITTEVLMSDGISYAPLTPETAPHWLYYLRSLNGLQLADYQGWQSIEEYLARLDRATAQNVVAQVPYANVRSIAMGWGRHPADDAQIRRMQREVRRGMEQGAAALSTGLDYLSQCYATNDEIAEVCSAMSEYRGLYVTHVRYKKGVLRGVKEAVEIAKKANVPLHVSHLKGSTPKEVDALLDYIDRVAVHEVDFSFDVYPYLPGSTMLNMLLPYEVWEDGPLSVLPKLADPVIRRRFEEQLADYKLNLEQIRFAWLGSTENQRFQGWTLGEFVRHRQTSPAQALADLLIDENLAVLCVFFEGEHGICGPFLAHEKFMLGSDGIFFPGAQVHPRQYASVPRILGRMVREEKLMTLESAIRKMSGYPAERFGLAGRGVLKEGCFADVVVFDPTTIIDQATFDQPVQLARGVEYVWVNGTCVVNDGRPLKEFTPHPPGRALKSRRV